MSSPLRQNTTTIQNLLNTINSLPEAGGVELPELSNEGSAAELFAGKELIDGNGEKVTGTFTIDSELSTQDSLITQIQTALQNKASASEPVLQTKTATPTTSAQNITPDSGYDGLSKVTVNAIPSTYVKPTATKAATTYTPTTSNQTIAAGTYCSGVQTIKGDANLKAENIAEGVSIFGVAGTHSGAEDLSTELTTQENLISQLSTILDSKASGGSGGSSCVSISVDNQMETSVYYFDSQGTVCEVSSGTIETISALNGVVYFQQEILTKYSGSYVNGSLMGSIVSIFLADGGSMICYSGGL